MHIPLIVRLVGWHYARRSSKYAKKVRASLSPDEIAELEEISSTAFDCDELSRQFREKADPAQVPHFLSSIFDPNPFARSSVILPYRRPALRFVPASERGALSLVPILVTSRY